MINGIQPTKAAGQERAASQEPLRSESKQSEALVVANHRNAYLRGLYRKANARYV